MALGRNHDKPEFKLPNFVYSQIEIFFAEDLDGSLAKLIIVIFKQKCKAVDDSLCTCAQESFLLQYLLYESNYYM